MLEPSEIVRVTIQPDPLSKALPRGRYAEIAHEIKEYTQAFRCKRTAPEDVNIGLFDFGERITLKNIWTAIVICGFEPATLFELSALGAERPDLQRRFHIFASGCCIDLGPFGMLMPFLTAEGRKRKLLVYSVGEIQGDNIRVAGYRPERLPGTHEHAPMIVHIQRLLRQSPHGR